MPDFNLYRISADGTSKLDTLYTATEYHGFNSISPDGKWLFLITHTQKTKMDICRLPYGEKSKPQIVIQTLFDEEAATLSPNGHWLAYHSETTRKYDVYIRSFLDKSKEAIKISKEGGWLPVWHADGKELYYQFVE